MREVTRGARMLPMLPCADIDEMERFWTALGLRVVYRQVRPNPYLAVQLDDLELHYYGMPGHRPEASHSTCGVVVSDTEPLFEAFAAGVREHTGRTPHAAAPPRLTRPRRRANNAGLSGFSLIDPAGNWIRVSCAPTSPDEGPRAVDDRVEWSSGGGGPLARALENAVVLGDSRGDPAQARRGLESVLVRHPDAPVGERAAAWAYLAQLRVQLGELDAARQCAAQVSALAEQAGRDPDERLAVERATEEVAELDLEPPDA